MANGCRRHTYGYERRGTEIIRTPCVECGRPFNAALSKRGRNNKDRGQTIQREIVERLGLINDPTGPTDGHSPTSPFVVSVKSGERFSVPDVLELERQAALHPDKTALLIKAETPGRGHKRRITVTLLWEDWLAWHGISLYP